MTTENAIQKKAGLIGGVAVFAGLMLAPAPEGMSPAAHCTGAVTLLMAVWWITEALPIPATALVPLALFPLLGVTSARNVIDPRRELTASQSPVSIPSSWASSG